MLVVRNEASVLQHRDDLLLGRPLHRLDLLILEREGRGIASVDLNEIEVVKAVVVIHREIRAHAREIDPDTDLLEELIREDYRGDLLSTYFMEGYQQMYLTEDGIAMFRGFFKELLDADGGAVLWHCVSGKDRTGNATMLLLTVLGVDKETIIEDFLLTNDYLAADRKATYKRVLDLTGSKRIAKDIASKDGVERRWIEESYKTIETYYGSIDNFLKKVIGLTAKDIKKLQKAYLTPAK